MKFLSTLNLNYQRFFHALYLGLVQPVVEEFADRKILSAIPNNGATRPLFGDQDFCCPIL